MIPPSRLPRRSISESDSLPERKDATTTEITAEQTDEYLQVVLGSVADEMQRLAEELSCRPPIYIFDDRGWHEPSLEEALAATIPLQDPEARARTNFGMGLCNVELSQYTRQPNDDLGVAPDVVMADVPSRVDVYTVEVDSDSDSDSDPEEGVLPPPLPANPPPTSARKRRVVVSAPRHRPAPTPTTTPARTRKRKSTSTSPDSPSSSSSSDSTLASITEFDDEPDSSSTEVDFELQSSPCPPPPRKARARPPHSGGSSPLKPKSAVAFAGYQCQMPGCAFSASSPQHIKHHYQTFQHGRLQSLQFD